MKNFFVQIVINDPYPKKFDVTGSAGTAEVALKRAMQKFRKEFWAKRPLTDFTAIVKKI